MAPRGERAGTPRERHGWLRFDAHREIHEAALDRHPSVEQDRTTFTRIEGDGIVYVTLDGDVLCTGGLVVEVSKFYEVRLRRRAEEIRGLRYRYTARIPGRGNIVRYDNLHEDAPDEYHRHEYELTTFTQTRLTVLSRQEMPVMTEIIDEAMLLAYDAGLI